MFLYFGSLVMSLFVLVMTIITMFSNADSNLYKYYGDTDTYFCLGISFVLLVIGYMSERRKET